MANDDRIAAAQRGILLSEALPAKRASARPAGAKRRAAAARGGPARRAGAGVLRGPLLTPGALSQPERLRLIDGLERAIEGAFAHLPLKRARYGVDPVQRLRILRTQAAELADDAFHFELADIVTGLRDAHTRYSGPDELEGKVAVPSFPYATGTREIELVGYAGDEVRQRRRFALGSGNEARATRPRRRARAATAPASAGR